MISTSFVVYFIAIILLTFTMILVSHLLNPKVPKRINNAPFESGIVGQGSTDIRWNINYFLVAISFVIFDIEAVFLYVWSIVVMEAGWHGFFITSFFISILLIALLYEIRQGAFLWGEKIPSKNSKKQFSKEA
ncbi:NADH-quinone oxidoreductase subunit A [Pseudoalteromonas sp. NBT06-2]|uniref:NADH-quinone oxidoreductase subunit A n=1 Tax=Pseudoalteromonas sp. NBT06-2 TaxID=2025950 RepID=UPI000BA6022A|nr:NADH-quinone oxidoreductase subunit A [Pseudoalteromonas sp. NBT06-2]PAJ73130.1 NADH-quinone oxidoreductase subunit A [Pseudoalteromonas sp. NBT06-2]